jgi:hypothetical protein
MRVGFNPIRTKLKLSFDYFHQIIIPVYIPNQEGYFKDGFTILKLCLNSLFKTIHKTLNSCESVFRDRIRIQKL